MEKPFYQRWWFIALVILIGVNVIGILSTYVEPPDSSKHRVDPNAGWTSKKWNLIKNMDDRLYKAGLCDKVEMGNAEGDRVDVTLDFRGANYRSILTWTRRDDTTGWNKTLREAGFKVLRLKDSHSNRYEDWRIE